MCTLSGTKVGLHWKELGRMIQKELGRTGILIPELGIGTWNYHAGPLILRKGLDLGALFIDTAESYGTEPVVGDALRGIRDRVFLDRKSTRLNSSHQII